MFQHDYLIKDINLQVQFNLFLQIDIVHCKSESFLILFVVVVKDMSLS